MSSWRWTTPARSAIQRRAIEDLAPALALSLEPETLRASIARRVTELVECDVAILCHHQPERDAYLGGVAATREHATPDLVFPVGGTLSRWLRANQEPLLVPHPQGAFDYLDDHERAQLTAVAARVCVPIFAGARLVAVLLICCAQPGWRMSSADLELVAWLAQHAGLALENAELHRLERDRLKGLHQAQQLAVAGQLAATVAHEIRNPLTAIRSTVQYVVESAIAWQEKRRLLEEILDEVDRIERTVGGMLALSRPHDYDHTDIDLVTTVEESFLLIHAYAHSHGIEFERQFEVDALPVRGDARALHQVCMNLFMNACQAMPDGGKILLQCGVWHPATEAAPLARLRIADTGTGISPENLSRVFTPSFTTKRNGTGLGLPICLDIVAGHGGTLRLDSEEGRGTAATVLLPLRTM